MISKMKWIGIGLLTLALCGGAAVAQTPGGHRWIGRHPLARRIVQRRAEARSEFRRFLDTLQVTDAQRAVALEEARAAEPIAREARREASRIRFEARRGPHTRDGRAAREEIRGRMKDLHDRTLVQLEPLARRVLSTLTPEQRTKLTDAAAKRGKSLDEARLVKITSWLLTRPMTASRLEARRSR
jgi:hypothetical protein